MTDETNGSSENGESVKSVDEYLKKIKALTKSEHRKYAYRGQGSTSYPINSSATRRLNIIGTEPAERKRFTEYNDTLITTAILKGYDQRGANHLKKLELLAELQHYGAATGLIDFTYSSLVALYFAVSGIKEDEKSDAVVYVIDTCNLNRFKRIKPEHLNEKFDDLLAKNGEKLWVWEPADLNNRIPKQHSLFIFGEPEIDKKFVDKVIINKNEKFSILDELERIHDISPNTLFSDFIGFAKVNSQDSPYFEFRFLHAMSLFNRKLITDPKNYEILLKRLEDALEANKGSIEALLMHANYNFKSENFPETIDDYDRIIKIKPGFSSAYLKRGEAKQKLGDIEGAKQDFEKAIDLDQANKWAHCMLEINKCLDFKEEEGNSNGSPSK